MAKRKKVLLPPGRPVQFDWNEIKREGEELAFNRLNSNYSNLPIDYISSVLRQLGRNVQGYTPLSVSFQKNVVLGASAGGWYETQMEDFTANFESFNNGGNWNSIGTPQNFQAFFWGRVRIGLQYTPAGSNYVIEAGIVKPSRVGGGTGYGNAFERLEMFSDIGGYPIVGGFTSVGYRSGQSPLGNNESLFTTVALRATTIAAGSLNLGMQWAFEGYKILTQ